MKHREGFRKSYHQRRARIVEEMLVQAAEFFEQANGSFGEDTPLIDLAAGDWHRVIAFSFEVEKKWRFEFPDPRVTKSGRLRQSRAEHIKTLGEFSEFICRLRRKKEVPHEGKRIPIPLRARAKAFAAASHDPEMELHASDPGPRRPVAAVRTL